MPYYFESGEFSVQPKPVITTNGLCFAISTEDMSRTFKESMYLEKFEKVFLGNNSGGPSYEWTGKGDQQVQISVDLRLSFLTDRISTGGTVR